MAAAYIYNIAEAKFNHATAIGSKTNIPNCQVKTADGFSNETIQIFTVDQGLKIVEATT
jgi:mannitol/fructose-specific phosphotransferase system IIA component